MEISVVIPIFNEALNIDILYQRLKEVLHKLNCSHELIFVNDGSTDHSFSLIHSYAQKDPQVRYINFSRNFGHQIAVYAGLEHAKGAHIVIIDADLQDSPQLIEEMYHKLLNENFDVVYAKRIKRKGETWWKKLSSKIFYRLLCKITTVAIPLDTGDYRIIKRKVADILKQMPEQQKFIRGQIAWIGFKQTAILFERDERAAGKSGYTLKKGLKLAFDGITSLSNFPLKLASIAGFSVSSITFFLALYALYSRFISKDYVPGWTSLMLVMLFIGGIQLICIGIIGEYLSRISDNVRNRPLYVVESTNTSR